MSEEYNEWRGGFWIRDTPGWQKKYPTGPVHFDIKCRCGIEHVDLALEKVPGSPEEFAAAFPCCFPKKK